MLNSIFAVFLVIKNSNQYSSISRKQLLPLISFWQIPTSIFQQAYSWSRTKHSHFATFLSLSFQAIPAIFIRYLASETAKKLNFYPELEEFPPITVHAKFSPSSVLTMRNTGIYHNLVMSRLMMSQVPKITSGTHIGLYISTSCQYPAEYQLCIQLGYK